MKNKNTACDAQYAYGDIFLLLRYNSSSHAGNFAALVLPHFNM